MAIIFIVVSIWVNILVVFAVVSAVSWILLSVEAIFRIKEVETEEGTEQPDAANPRPADAGSGS